METEKETYQIVKGFVFDRPIVDDKGIPLNMYDVILVSMEISKRLQQSHEMSIGFTVKYGGCKQVHHYNARVLSILNKLGIEEIKIDD